MRAMSAASSAKPDKQGFFARMRDKLGGGPLAALPFGGRRLDADLEATLEDELLLADVGIEAADRIIQGLRRRVSRQSASEECGVRAALRETIAELLADHARPLEIDPGYRPFLLLVVGVNGSGKTTTIGKLAGKLRARGFICHAGRRRHVSRGRHRTIAGLGRAQ